MILLHCYWEATCINGSCLYGHMAKRPIPHLMSPCYTKRQPNHNLIYTVDHPFGYCSKKFICACAKTSTHAQGT